MTVEGHAGEHQHGAQRTDLHTAFDLTNNSTDTLNLVTNDLGNTGSGGPLTASNTVNITLNHIDLPPVNTVPGSQTTSENTALTFSAANGNQISVADSDSRGNPEQVTLTVSNGTLALNGTSGLTFTTGTGTANATMTFTGTLANINTALNGLVYTPTSNFAGTDSLQINTSDLGNSGVGGPRSATSTVSMLVNSIQPTVSVPGPQVSSQYGVVFSSANGNAITVGMSNGETVQVSLAATNGTLTLAGTSGLSFSVGNGQGDSTIVFRGTATAANSALNGLTLLTTALSSNLQVSSHESECERQWSVGGGLDYPGAIDSASTAQSKPD